MLRWLLFLVLLLPLGGCLPSEGRLDDEKDPHFQEGRNLVNSQDFKGAMDEFEKALQSNPHSAAAHFELGWLCEKAGDFAGAIYHYQRHLQLQPNSPHAATAKDRIRGCKQQLANSEFPLPESQNLQREINRLTDENALLRQQADALRTQLAARPPAANPAPPSRPTPSEAPVRQEPRAQPSTPAPAERAKVYVVREHDTITAIAARCGVKPSALLSANPHVDPRRLRVGQSLNIP
ncbi:MAG TPA: tetratricopeptide repeat protein [Verrucomicrobiae bacterium]|jgi:Tfp pilus assembly protein PilF|nr:tetratricopeptide repeat protein [Verrucomicrobiae bacterium]